MARFQLRIQLLVAAIVILSAFTGAILLIVRYAVQSEIRQQAAQSVEASVHAFKNVEAQRDDELSRTASLLAELPPVMALMTTEHAPTIQDASEPFWRLAGSDLFLLADSSGRVLGLHTTETGFTPELAQRKLRDLLERQFDASWWLADNRLYRIVLRPITIGSDASLRQLGILVIGYKVDSKMADQLATVSGAQIVLSVSHTLIASTLSTEEDAAFRRWIDAEGSSGSRGTKDISLGSHRYESASVMIGGDSAAPIRCYVLVSLDRLNLFVRNLDNLIFVLGISAVLLSTVLLGFVARTITRPLDNLVSGVRALSAGDYTYSIPPRGSSEVAELAEAFSVMRGEILASHEQRIVTERITALGRAAGSLSHDLRHYLAAIVANAEFLFEAKDSVSRTETYNEIKLASDQMTELLDSLRELVHGEHAISPEHAALDQIIRRGANSVLARPEWRHRDVSIEVSGDMDGVFDARKMERVFFNLILNACEATTQSTEPVRITVESSAKSFDVRVADNGPGIPPAIQNVVFEPFVSSGKPGGTGLGLAIVHKIVRDHDGSVVIERTSSSGTILLVRLPRFAKSADAGTIAVSASLQT